MERTVDEWYACDIDRKRLKALMGRDDAKGLARFGAFLALTGATGYAAWLSLGTASVVPAFLLYGTIFAFAEAANHELIHGTVFRSRWLNETAYWISCFMSWREPVFGRYRHAKHHTHTSIVGKDTEGATNRARSLFILGTEMLLRYRHARTHLGAMLHHGAGLRGAWAVIPPALWKQHRDPDFHPTPVPPTP